MIIMSSRLFENAKSHMECLLRYLFKRKGRYTNTSATFRDITITIQIYFNYVYGKTGDGGKRNMFFRSYFPLMLCIHSGIIIIS